jgi:outer membrane protein, heavy metal efflux system
MASPRFAVLCAAFAFIVPASLSAQAPRPLTLQQALQRSLAANPRLPIAERNVGMSEGRQQQAGMYPNPSVSFEIDHALAAGRSSETTLQLSQLVELAAKRDARVSAALADYDATRYQQAAVRLELLSDVAVAFVAVLSAQQRVQLFDRQITALERLVPLMQRRVEAGASSPADVSRTQVAIGLARIDRERAKTSLAAARRDLAAQLATTAPDFTAVAGEFGRVAKPPAFSSILEAIERNPQLLRWTAVRAQRDAEALSARLKPVPDLQASIGWRHYADNNTNGVRFGVAVPIPAWDRNQGAIREAQEAAAKTEAERAANRLTLIAIVGRAYDTLNGALQEIDLLRRAIIPDARKTFAIIEDGYGQGRFTVLDVLDAYRVVTEAELREQEALQAFHVAVATIEGLTGSPLTLAGGRPR